MGNMNQEIKKKNVRFNPHQKIPSAAERPHWSAGIPWCPLTPTRKFPLLCLQSSSHEHVFWRRRGEKKGKCVVFAATDTDDSPEFLWTEVDSSQLIDDSRGLSLKQRSWTTGEERNRRELFWRLPRGDTFKERNWCSAFSRFHFLRPDFPSDKLNFILNAMHLNLGHFPFRTLWDESEFLLLL